MRADELTRFRGRYASIERAPRARGIGLPVGGSPMITPDEQRPPSGDEPAPVIITAIAARSAVKLGRMRYVLGISLVMAIVLCIVAFLIA
jgi:hypothetical protein